MKKLLIVLLLFSLVGCAKTEDKVKNYLASGKTLFEQKNYDKAKIEFKNVIQLDNKNVEAYYHLALIDEEKQNWQSMFGNLMQVVRNDPQNIQALLKLTRLNLLSNRPNDALKHIDTLLKLSPDNPDALSLKGAVLVKQGSFDQAMELAEQVLKQHPDNSDAVSLKTVVFLTKNNPAAALETVEKALSLKPADLSLQLLLLQVHAQSKNNAAVEQDYLNLIKAYPDKLEYTYALVKHYAEIGDAEKAHSALKTLIETHPNEMKPKFVMVDFLMQKKPDQVEKTLAGYLAQYPEEPEFHFRSAEYYLKSNKINEAKQALNRIVELKPESKEGHNAKITLAKLAVQEKDTELAQKLVNQVLSEDGRNLEGLLMKAKLNMQKGAYDEAITDLRVVLRDYSNSDEALVLIAQAYIRKNSPELAEENFRKALTVNPANFDALIPVASNLIKNKEVNRAEELLQKALSIKPDHPGALQALAEVKILQKDWQGSQKVADVIASKPKGAGYSKFIGGKISEEQGLCKEAIGQYKEALIITPDLIDALRGIASCYEKLKTIKEMYPYLDEFIAAHPNDTYPWLLKGQLLAKETRIDDALKLLAEAIGKWPKTPEFYEAVASIHLERKDAVKAIEAINQGLKAMPEQIRLTMFLASAYEQTGDYENALKTYEALTAKNPNVDVIVNNLVSLLLDHFNTPENVTRAVTLAQRFERSDQPYFVDSYGWALLNSGKYDEALKVLREVVKTMPQVPVFRYHLGLAYHKTNNAALAVSELEEALKLGKNSGGFAEEKATEELLKTIKG